MSAINTFRIGIDCRLSGNTHAGIGRYIENLITRLPLDKKITWVLFFYEEKQIPTHTSFQKAIQDKKIETILAPIKHYTLAEQLQMPNIFANQNLDIIHVPHFNVPLGIKSKEKLIVTIHDLLWHEQRGMHVTTLPAWKYWIKYLAYNLVASHALFRSETILVPSQTVKETIIRYYKSLANKIVVTYEGADQHQTTSTSNKRLQTNTLLYVGSLYPHKNIQIVLKALQKNKDLQLEIVGSRNVFQDQVKEKALQLGVADQVNFLGYVPDETLLEKYQTALALIQPSLSEGFGLTGLEAMSAGGCLVASDIPIFKEIYKDGALLFDPKSPTSLLEKVAVLQALSSSEREALKKKGKHIAQQYSWQKMVDQTIDQYLHILEK